MVILSISQVSELKRMLKEKFRMELHLHDGCGGQYFFFDVVPSEALTRALDKHLSKKRLCAVFDEDGMRFTVERRL